MKYRNENNSIDEVYCYPNGVLKNKLGIMDEDTLSKLEAEITSINLASFLINPVKGKLDFKHYKKIHKEIFGDIFAFAGKTRTVSMSKGTTAFCMWMYIDEQCEKTFESIKIEILENKRYKEIEKEEFIRLIVKYMTELNVIHPFREGNGRTLREYFRLLCLKCGYELNYASSTKDEILGADIASFQGNEELILNLLNKTIKKID